MSAITTHNAIIEVWYYRSWGAMHILLGILFSIIFVMGALILDNLFTPGLSAFKFWNDLHGCCQNQKTLPDLF
jgi:hypothetical protein